MNGGELLNREMLMHRVTEDIVEVAHRKIWHGELTSQEARLVWMRVIEKMLTSLVIEQQGKVIAESIYDG